MQALTRPCKNAFSLVARWSRMQHTLPPVANIAAGSSNLPQNFLPTPAAVAAAEAEFELSQASQIIHGRGILPAYYHPRTHNIPVATIHFRSYHRPLLDLFIHFTTHTAAALGIPISRTIPLPTQRSLWTVPRSPFVFKGSQENFERRTYKRLIKAWDADDAVLNVWIKFLERHEMAGVGLRVVRWQRAPVGVGQKAVEAVKRQMRLDVGTSKEKVKALGEKIVKEETAAAEAAERAGVDPVVQVAQSATAPKP